MCARCNEIDAKIKRYRRLSQAVHDEPTTERFAAAIEELESEKFSLHPEPEK